MDATIATTSNIPSTLAALTVGSSYDKDIHTGSEATPFVPQEPRSWDDVGIHPNDIGGLILKYLGNVGQATGRAIAEQLKLPYSLVNDLLRSLRNQFHLQHRSTSVIGDYEYELTVQGLEKARLLSDQCSYCGAAPVSLDMYLTSVRGQSIYRHRVRPAKIREAFSDMLIDECRLSLLGQAIGATQGLFLYGPPGNGKTCIAERLMRSVGDTIWIPRAISIASELIRLYDPATHIEVRDEATTELLSQTQTDRRWVRILRPTVCVGGELKLEHLDVQYNSARGVNEAPLQLKGNCGALVIDDFGRQRCSTRELLNRLIVPLEKRFDLISLPSGRQVQIPFESFLVFATNLEPQELFDEAFLRRLPYKVAVSDPTQLEFLQLFQRITQQLDIRFDQAVFQHLLDSYYSPQQRAFRFCQPRDLLLQIATYCDYHEIPREMSIETMDVVAKLYFAGL